MSSVFYYFIFLTLMASDPKEGLMMAASHFPDLIVLDLGLPDIDGVEVIEHIRTWSDVPIIIVSARSEDRDKITALDKGADDYLTKPFSVDELLARLRVIQRRLMKSENISVTEFVNGRLRIDYVSGCVHLDDEDDVQPTQETEMAVITQSSTRLASVNSSTSSSNMIVMIRDPHTHTLSPYYLIPHSAFSNEDTRSSDSSHILSEYPSLSTNSPASEIPPAPITLPAEGSIKE